MNIVEFQQRYAALSRDVIEHALRADVALTDLHLAQRERLRYYLYLGNTGKYVENVRIKKLRADVLVHYRNFLRSKRELLTLEQEFENERSTRYSDSRSDPEAPPAGGRPI